VTAVFLKLTALYKVRRHLLPCSRAVHSVRPACLVSHPSRHLPGEGIAFRIQILAGALMRSAFVRPRTDHPWRRFLLHIRNDRPWEWSLCYIRTDRPWEWSSCHIRTDQGLKYRESGIPVIFPALTQKCRCSVLN